MFTLIRFCDIKPLELILAVKALELAKSSGVVLLVRHRRFNQLLHWEMLSHNDNSFGLVTREVDLKVILCEKTDKDFKMPNFRHAFCLAVNSTP
jgi:hypothetical protein